MFKKFSNKHFFYLYTAGVLVALWLVFSIAIKPTLNLYKSVHEKMQVVKSISSAQQQIALLKKRQLTMDKSFGSYALPDSNSRERILQEISQYCDKRYIQFYYYPENHIFNKKSYTIETNQVILRGNFKELLELIYFLENINDFDKIISVNFYAELNRRTKQKELYLALIIQNIRKNE
jgi:hypothetical protein